MFGVRKGLRLAAWLVVIATGTWSATPCICAEELPLPGQRPRLGAQAIPPQHCHDAGEHDGDADEDGHCDHHEASEQRLVLKAHGAFDIAAGVLAPVRVAYAAAFRVVGHAVAMPLPRISSSGRLLLGRRCTLLL